MFVPTFGAAECETAHVRIDRWDVYTVPLELCDPFAAAHSTVSRRDVLLVRLRAGGLEGWAECGVLPAAGYGTDTVASAAEVLAHAALPALVQGGDLRPDDVGRVLRDVNDHREVVAAVEVALVDAECRASGESLARWLARQLAVAGDSAACRPRVPAGVALGLGESPGQTAEVAARHVAAGYRRVKVKIAPSSDVEVLRSVRDRVGDAVDLFADANGVYGPDDVEHLRELEDFALGCLEQPFDRDDLSSHAVLARATTTPVCLDESIRSLDDLCKAVDLGACSVLNLKWSRVGGLLESVRILRECRNRGVDAWIGGMLSSGVGRAVDVALASLDPVTMIGDISESARYFTDDLTTPFVMVAGEIAVPDGPGLGVEIDVERIEAEATMHRSSRD